jgi:TolB protein
MARLLFTFLFTLFYSNVYAVLKIDITQGNVEPLPVALSLFKVDNGSGKISQELYEVIKNDLESSGLFEMISPKAFLQTVDVNGIPLYSNWRQINASVLIAGNLSIEAGILHVSFKIWDPYGERLLDGMSYSAEIRQWRRIAHKVADRIYEKMTGEKGMFDSRILYIAESGQHTKRVKRLAIMDQDGANNKFLTDGKDMCLTPRFDFKSHRAIYMSYKSRVPQVYILDIATGRQELLGRFPGMSFAPRFSPDGNSAIMSIAKNGSTNIFLLDLNSRKLKRLTNDVGVINTSPSFSPDGSKITFNSDRGGSPKLYVMDADGSNVSRISNNPGSYGTPVWSPRGDYIAFTKISKGMFSIGVMRPDGSGERILTSSWLEEGPTWSPNGRTIMFSRQIGTGARARNEIYAIDLTGYHERLVRTSTEASDPAWSPLLP